MNNPQANLVRFRRVLEGPVKLPLFVEKTFRADAADFVAIAMQLSCTKARRLSKTGGIVEEADDFNSVPAVFERQGLAFRYQGMQKRGSGKSVQAS